MENYIEDQEQLYDGITDYNIEKYLGKGKKMSGVSRDQAELVYLVVTEIQDDLVNGEKK